MNYSLGNEITYSAEVLKFNLCHYEDAYILVRGDITTMGHNRATDIAFKNCAPFINCITKIDGTTIDDTEELVILMYNLI